MINSLFSDFCCSLICFLSNFCMWKYLCGSWEAHFNNLVSEIQTLNGHFYLDTQLFPSHCFRLSASRGLRTWLMNPEFCFIYCNILYYFPLSLVHLLIGKKKKKGGGRKKRWNKYKRLSWMLHFQGEMNNNVATKDCKTTAFDRNSVWDDKYLSIGLIQPRCLFYSFCFWRKYGIFRKMANTKYCSKTNKQTKKPMTIKDLCFALFPFSC